MKKAVFTLAFMAVSGTAMYAQSTGSSTIVAQQPATENAGKFNFKEETWNFGEVTEGPDISHDFEFTNTGKTPIFIRNASAGCGCTVADWPHEPILPGATSKIKVTFHTKGRPGVATKVVSIDSDAQQQAMHLTITANVKAQPAEPQKTAVVK